MTYPFLNEESNKRISRLLKYMEWNFYGTIASVFVVGMFTGAAIALYLFL